MHCALAKTQWDGPHCWCDESFLFRPAHHSRFPTPSLTCWAGSAVRLWSGGLLTLHGTSRTRGLALSCVPTGPATALPFRACFLFFHLSAGALGRPPRAEG